MQGEVEDARIALEDLLRPVAVVHVPVEQQHAREAVHVHGGLGGHRSAVEEAEAAHAVGASVVAGRADDRKARPQPAGANAVGQSQHTARREPRRPRRCCVVVHVRSGSRPSVRRLAQRPRGSGDFAKPATCLTRGRVLQRIERIAVLGGVTAKSLRAVCLSHRHPLAASGQPAFFELLPHELRAFGLFAMLL